MTECVETECVETECVCVYKQCQTYLVPGERASPLSFCCLNVFTFLSVNIKDFYCAF